MVEFGDERTTALCGQAKQILQEMAQQEGVASDDAAIKASLTRYVEVYDKLKELRGFLQSFCHLKGFNERLQNMADDEGDDIERAIATAYENNFRKRK